MHSYVYCWSLQEDQDIQIELRIAAASAVEARRALVEFLGRHDGSDWSLTAVAREFDPHALAHASLARAH